MLISSYSLYASDGDSFPHVQSSPLIPESVLKPIAQNSSLCSLQSVQLYSENPTDISRLLSLDAEESSMVANAVKKRKSEFADARYCAHLILNSHGERSSILRGKQGMPLFPPGYCGSLSHSGLWRVALIGEEKESTRDTRYRRESLGVDIEELSSFNREIRAMIFSPEEEKRIYQNCLSFLSIQRQGGLIDAMAKNFSSTVGFSIKEAIYKAWFPLRGLFLDFHQAKIEELALLEKTEEYFPFLMGQWRARITIGSEYPEFLCGTWFYYPEGFAPSGNSTQPPLVGALSVYSFLKNTDER